MKIKSSHIFRSFTISFLMAGFLAHLVVPFSSQAQKTAFTRWLDHNVVESGNENEIKLRNSIKDLPEQTGDFWLMIQHASELVANHRDDFRIPVSKCEHEKSQDVSALLIDQWNTYQNQESGFNSVLSEIVMSPSNWISQSGSLTFFINSSNQHPDRFQTDEILSITNVFPRLIIPLINSISINAP